MAATRVGSDGGGRSKMLIGVVIVLFVVAGAFAFKNYAGKSIEEQYAEQLQEAQPSQPEAAADDTSGSIDLGGEEQAEDTGSEVAAGDEPSEDETGSAEPVQRVKKRQMGLKPRPE